MLAGFYYCPHHPLGSVPAYARACRCRKPRPGLVLRAAAELDLDVRASWLIGDILDDVEAGNRAGCRSILLANGNETKWRDGPYRQPYAAVPTLAAAADCILTHSPERSYPAVTGVAP